MYVIETWRFIQNRFEPDRSLGLFFSEAEAVGIMWETIRSSGKDMGRFRVSKV